MPEVTFQGPAGRIEGRYHQSKQAGAPIAIILHPHPQHGGTMNNKITYTLYQSFVKKGFSTLRFNFRGVGRSEGKYDNGEGELSDAACALDWIQHQNPNAGGHWVAGFSFGAWVAMQLLMRRPELQRFITVAPPAKRYDFSFLAPCPTSGLILQGLMDEVIQEMEVQKLAERLNKQKNINVDYKTYDQAGHFFENHLEDLHEDVTEYIDRILSGKVQNEKSRKK